jgi:MFS family permease
VTAAGQATEQAGAPTAGRTLVPALLRDTVFRRYWSASTASMAGDQVSSIAVPLTAVLVLHAGAAEFASGFGVMVLDISIGSIFAAVIPDQVRSRVTGAFQAVNYGTRPAGALLGGLLGVVLGLRAALWVAVAGAAAGALLLLPSPVPGFRMPGRR